MNEDINPEILEKIKNSSQPNNVKEFLYEVLDLEYDKSDEAQPRVKSEYTKLITKYKNSINRNLR